MIELLAVMAVILILAVLSITAITSVKNSARATQCLSNLRQIAVASLTYAGEHDNTLPDGKEGAGIATANIMRTQLISYLPRNKDKDVWFCPAQSGFPSVLAYYYYPNSRSLGLRLHAVTDQTQIVLWRDRGYNPGLGGDTTLEPRSPGPHRTAYNTCFADGHVERLRDKETLMNLMKNYPPANP